MKKHIFVILTGISALIAGCSDDALTPVTSSSPYMAFNASLTASESSSSRSTASQTVLGEPVRMQFKSTGDSIYLLDMVSDPETSVVDFTSRSTIVNSADELYDRFYVSAYKYDDTWDDDHCSQSPNYFVMAEAVKSGSQYVMSPVRYWPSDGKMRFLAHAPVGDNAFTFYPVDDADRGPRVHIKIADNVEDQNDLVVSYSDEIACDGTATTANMNFKHALTGIRFTADKSMPKGVITNITFKGVRYEGDFFYNMQDAEQASSADLSIDDNFNPWEIYDKTFSLDLNSSVTGDEDAVINDGENTFIMFPQTLPADASVEITFQYADNSGNLTDQTDVITGSLAGRKWPAGKIVTYKLSTSAQILNITEPDTLDYLGYSYDADGSILESNSVTVSSYAGDKNIPWTIEYQDEGSSTWSTESEWLSVDPSWTWQDASQQEVPFVAKSSYNSIDIDENLKDAEPLGTSADPYNLSSSSGAEVVENTANCYIVSAPGYYMLPLVYGNAIMNSATNSAAYASTASGSNVLTDFQNHLGEAITDPYIADNAGCVPAKAGIVWQDVENLVQNVEYVADAFDGKGGIEFYVSPSTIAQGNAVISISDNSNIMWSWHIWVTSFSGFDSTIDITNQDGNTFSLMPVNLGWCSNGEPLRYYPKRQCKVRFVPTLGDESLAREITFVQEDHLSVPFGNNPYYQWGRKDPFVGTNIAWGNKERWDGTGKYYGTGSENNPPRLFSDLVEDSASDRLTTKQCLDLMIKNPDKWHNPPAKVGGSSYVSLNETYSNLWGENTLINTKTVYDPCPPGYQVNYFYTYTGFLEKGFDWSSDEGIEFVKETAPDWDTTNLAEFYTDTSRLHSITFPVCGYRDWNDKAEVVDFTVRGFIWLRGLSDELNAYMFRYAPHIVGQANVAPFTMFYSTDGLPVRPALSE